MATPKQAERAKRLVAPCTRECPAGIDVPRYIGYIAVGQFGNADAVVRERLPLPGICGYVCYHPCQPGCRRAQMDDPIAINHLKRAAYDMSDRPWLQQWEESIAPPSGKHVAVVGSGPAGLTVAYYLARRGGHQVTIFEAHSEAGGQLRIGIPRYRLPRPVLEDHLDLLCRTRVSIKVSHPVRSLDELQEYDAVFLAIGTCQARPMGIEGEDLPGVMSCVDFLRAINLGEPVTVGPRVAVIGGGNVAMDGARTALRLGASPATIVYRRSREEMPAHDFEVHEAEVEGVEFQFLAAPRAVERVDGHLRLHVQQMALGEPDASGRRRPVPVPGGEFFLDTDTILSAIGQETGMTPEWGLELNSNGTIAVDPETLQTSQPGVFAAGDAVTGPVSVIEAVAGGRQAAQAIDRYLGGSGDIEETLAPSSGEEMRIPAGLKAMGAVQVSMSTQEPWRRARTFDLAELGYSTEDALAEAERCLRCDLWRLEGMPSVWPKGKKA